MERDQSSSCFLKWTDFFNELVIDKKKKSKKHQDNCTPRINQARLKLLITLNVFFGEDIKKKNIRDGQTIITTYFN